MTVAYPWTTHGWKKLPCTKSQAQKRIAGIDEAGRGPLAGPVVAAVVILPEGYSSPLFKDSKKLSAKQRDKAVEEIVTVSIGWAVVAVGPRRIEQINIREATRLAMLLAATALNAESLLIDGDTPLATRLPQQTIIKGDSLVQSISAASILAKTWRDALMEVCNDRFPGYGFNAHAGYPTAFHRNAIKEIGPSRIHRRTFAGVREFVQP